MVVSRNNASASTRLIKLSVHADSDISSSENGRSPSVYVGSLSAVSLVEQYRATMPTIPIATQSPIRSPTDMCSDNSGNVYIADSTTASVYKFNTITNVIERFLGVGTINTGDSIPTNRPASRTPIWEPRFLAFINGSLYVTTYKLSGGGGIQKVVVIKVSGTRITARNIVTLETGVDYTFINSIGYDYLGNIFYNVSSTSAGATRGFYKYTSTGPNSGSAVKRTDTVVSNGGTPFLDSAGNMYVRNLNEITKLTASADKSIDIGSTATLILDTVVNSSDFKIHSSGAIYYSEIGVNNIVKHSSGTFTQLNTSTTTGFSGDNGPIRNANIFTGIISPAGNFASASMLALDGPGNLYFLDYGNKRIRKITATNGVITPDSIVTTIIGNGGDGNPYVSPISGMS